MIPCGLVSPGEDAMPQLGESTGGKHDCSEVRPGNMLGAMVPNSEVNQLVIIWESVVVVV